MQKKLEDAKARLAEAMASSGAENGAASAQKAPASSGAEAEGSEVPEQSADAALSDGSMETKAIQVEISNLNSQLMTLYKRQQELSQSGSGGASMDGLGTRAGINTPGIGVPGGKGQRMPVNA